MRVLLTGSHGFIGQAVARRMRDAGKHELFCLDRKDILAAVAWQPDAVIHCAWGGVAQGGREDDAIQDQSLVFTQSVAAFLHATCRRFVGVGSQAELNQQDSPYARAKVRAKDGLALICDRADISFAWARLYSVYGPGDAPTNYIPYVIRALLSGDDVPLTDQDILWDFLYVDDAADALIHLAEATDQGDFEVGFGASVSTRSIAVFLASRINPAAKLLFGAKPTRAREIDGLWCENSRLHSLGWFARVPLSDGLDRTIAWERARSQEVVT